MNVILKNCNEKYAVCEMVNAYLPKRKIEIHTQPCTGDCLTVEVNGNERDGYEYFAKLKLDGKSVQSTYKSGEYNKTHIKRVISNCFEKILLITLPWGLLTGIRPAKIVREMHLSGKNYNEIYNYFCDFYCARDDKAKLSIEVAKAQAPIINAMSPNSVSVYIGIPFCPTRCLYCSFTSQSVKFSSKLVEPYMDALIKEIDVISGLIKKSGKNIETVYIGGGTPTSLNEDNLYKLLYNTVNKFDFSHIREFTVEAGRPDTITQQKLDIMKHFGVDRISINPQSMNPETLKIIGRCHTPEDIIKTFEIAKNTGFTHINTDLIAGLPGETIDDFKYTLSQIEKLNPSSVTVHTMSIKHGSYLDMNYSMYTKTASDTVSGMLSEAGSLMRKMGKHPYYLYRQKNMLANLENVGYCTNGGECLYNIYIMDEVQSIVALGAGGSSKLIDGERIERAFNVKEVSEYIKRIDEMIERKTKLFGFDM